MEPESLGYSVGILKKGFLQKRSRHQKETGFLLKANWRLRYFVLNDNKLTYYLNETSLKAPHGDLLLVDDSFVSHEAPLDGQQFVFKVSTPFDSMVMAATNEQERNEWVDAFEKAIDLMKMSLRGYMITHNETLVDLLSTQTIRKFFVFHDRTLYVHKDHEHTTTCQFSMKISHRTKCTMDEQTSTILVVDDRGGKIDMIFEQRNIREIKVWYRALQTKIAAIKSEYIQGEIKNYRNTAQIEGIVGLRIPEKENQWEVRLATLNDHDLVFISIDPKGNPVDITEIVNIKDSATINESDIRPNSIEIVSAERVLHICLKTKEQKNSWLQQLRSMIIKDKNLIEPEIINASWNLIKNDKFYEIQYLEKKEIGVAFGREGNWLMVTMSDYETTGIHPGSALTKFNNENLILSDIQTTKLKMSGWKPPLTLTFRQPPYRIGGLQRKINATDGTTKWKKNYFELTNGKFYCKSTEESVETIMELPLKGAIIMQLSKDVCGKRHAFKIINGNSSLLLRADNHDEMKEWVSTLYHAIDIANGGKQVIEYEKQRVLETQMTSTPVNIFKSEVAQRSLLSHLENAVRREKLDEIIEILEKIDIAGISNDAVTHARHVVGRIMKAKSLESYNAKQDTASVSATESTEMEIANPSAVKDVQGYTVTSRPEMTMSDMSMTESNHIRISEGINSSTVTYKERVAVDDISSMETSTIHSTGKAIIHTRDIYVSDMSSSEGTTHSAPTGTGYRQNLTSAHINEMTSTDAVVQNRQSVGYSLEIAQINVADTVTTDAATVSSEGYDYAFNYKQKFRTSIRNSVVSDAGSVITNEAFIETAVETTEAVEEYFEEEVEDEIIEELKEEEVKVSKWGPPATEEDIRAFYRKFSHSGENNQQYINAMRFCNLFRMITEIKGNLYQEMLTFERFSTTAKIGVMYEDDFVQGWLKLAEESGSDDYLCHIRYLVDEDQMLF